MDLLLKFFANNFLKPFLKFYLRKERTYTHKGFRLVVSPGVFHPGFFFSTKFLADFVSKLELKNKKICEPGVGAGLISLSALRKGALVTAFDVNAAAIDNCKRNFELNKSLFTNPSFTIYQSDLFDQIPIQTFDYVAVNPPYFFGKISNDASMAWYAGEEGEYFEKFFRQLGDYLHADSKIYMILADNCELEKIEFIAAKYGFQFSLAESKKIWWERNFIFEIRK
ncbi:MAG TPA: methyltransferase [Cytophagaceae bacterium]|jgi:release factor glutamine methyltransferase|nr:methyltransferase [Cytophagaceae bacterium]